MASSPNVPAPTISFGSLFAQYGIDDRPSNGILSSPALQDPLASQSAAFDFDNDTPLRMTAKPAASAYLRPNAGGVFLFSQPPADPSLVASIPSSHHSSYAAPEPSVQVVDQGETPEWSQTGFEEALQPITFPESVQATPSKARSVSATPAGTPLGVGFATPATVRRFRRTVSGLGTPSAHPSAGRIRTLSNDNYSVPPSPSPARRRVDSSTSLTTNLPLSRNVSMQSRIFSGASTASFDVQSPQMGAHDMGIPMPEFIFPTMPDLIGSQHPSPQLSQGKSPLTTPAQVGGDVFFASPANLYPSAPGSSLMAGVDQVMGMGSVPNSTSMMSIDSFAPHSQGHYRTNTLDTISETPLLEQDQMPMMSFQHYQPTFAPPPVEYPQVPGMHMQYHSGSNVDIPRWQEEARLRTADHHPATWMPSGPPPQPNPFARTVSSGSIYPDSNIPGSVAMGLRSVSMPSSSAQSSSSSMAIPGLPTAPGTTGLFGSDQEGHEASRKRMHSGSSSVLNSPDTPRRIKHPRVGNYMRPGPKPKGNTPKKARSSSNPVSSPPAASSINPALIGGGVFGGPIQPSQFGLSAGPSEAVQLHLQPQPRALTFGGDLVAEAMSRSNSAQTIIVPAQPAPQPQLVIQPARAAGADQTVSGLPRSFLEKLYTTYLTTEGSHTGQPVKRFRCLIEGCERNFPRKSAIHSHIQTHLEDKPFQCEAEDWYVFAFCCKVFANGSGAAFVRQHDLRRHMRIHSGTKPFPCLW